jgi:hypothetical protein
MNIYTSETKHHKVCSFSFQVRPLCVAVLGDVLYVKGGRDVSSLIHKTAERYDDMRVRHVCASATALNGNMTNMKQEGIHTKCIVNWMHNVDVMSVRQHANVLSVIAIRSWCLLLKNRKLLMQHNTISVSHVGKTMITIWVWYTKLGCVILRYFFKLCLVNVPYVEGNVYGWSRFVRINISVTIISHR